MKRQREKWQNYIIQRGMLKIYYPFMICNGISEKTKILHDIQNLDLCIAKETYSGSIINFSLKDEFLMKSMQCKKLNIGFNEKQTEKEKGDKYYEEVAATIEFDKNTKNNLFIKKQQDFIEREKQKLNQEKQVFGLKAVTSKQLFFLRPALFENCEGRLETINISCNIFFNGYGILIADLPLERISVCPLVNLEYEKMYKKLYYIQDNKNSYECIDFKQVLIDSIALEYTNRISKGIGCEINKYEPFHMLFIDSFSAENRINFRQNPSLEYKEFVYRLLCAPVTTEGLSEQEVENIWRISQFKLSHTIFFFSEVGRGVAYSTIQEPLEPQSKLLQMDIAMVLPIETCLLKKINYESTLENARKFEWNKSTKIKMLYISNENYISGLKIQSMGSVYKMIDFMCKQLKYYLKRDLFEDEYRNINEMINLHNEGVKERLAATISYISFLITGILSLPMILDTVKILRVLISIADLPYITMEFVAIGIWLVLLIISGTFFFKFARNRELRVKKVNFTLFSSAKSDLNDERS